MISLHGFGDNGCIQDLIAELNNYEPEYRPWLLAGMLAVHCELTIAKAIPAAEAIIAACTESED